MRLFWALNDGLEEACSSASVISKIIIFHLEYAPEQNTGIILMWRYDAVSHQEAENHGRNASLVTCKTKAGKESTVCTESLHLLGQFCY